MTMRLRRCAPRWLPTWISLGYPFTFHETREEWEAEQRNYEEFSRRCDENERLRQAGLLQDDGPCGAGGASSAIWQRSYSAPETGREAPGLRLFGIAGHLGELTTDLQDPRGGAEFVESLNRYFGNVRSALDEVIVLNEVRITVSKSPALSAVVR